MAEQGKVSGGAAAAAPSERRRQILARAS